MDKHSSFYIR